MKKSKVLRNILYNGTYQLLLVLLPLITVPYISRVLGASNIGIYAYYFTFAAYFVMFSRLGVNNYGSRSIAEVADDRDKLQQVFSQIYGLQFLVSCIAIGVYACLIPFVDNLSVYLCAGLYVLSGISDINWLYFGLEEFKKTALRSMLIKILSVVMIFVCVKTKDDIIPYTLICCGTHLVTNLILWAMLPMIKVRLNLSEFKYAFRHFKSMLVLFLPTLGISLYNFMDKLMLGSMVEIHELGFYQSAESIMSVPVTLVAAVGTVMLPRMTSLYSKGEEKNAEKYIMLSMWLTLCFVSAFSFGVFSAAPEFTTIFYGPGFEPCVLLLQILMFAPLFLAMANVVRKQVLLPKKMDKVFVGSIFAGAAINLLLNWLTIPKYGAVGAAVATVVAECTVFLIQTIYCIKLVPIVKFIRQALPFVLIGLAMTGILYVIPFGDNDILTLVLKIIIGGIFYVAFSALYYVAVLKRGMNSERKT